MIWPCKSYSSQPWYSGADQFQGQISKALWNLRIRSQHFFKNQNTLDTLILASNKFHTYEFIR